MNNTTKQWAIVALAFVAGFGVSRYGNFGGHRRAAQQHEVGGKRAQWAKGVKERIEARDQRGPWSRGEGNKGRKKGENGPKK